jgi:hypothetical protein
LRVRKVSSKAVKGESALEEEKEVTIPFDEIKTIEIQQYEAYISPAKGAAQASGFLLLVLLALVVGAGAVLAGL